MSSDDVDDDKSDSSESSEDDILTFESSSEDDFSDESDTVDDSYDPEGVTSDDDAGECCHWSKSVEEGMQDTIRPDDNLTEYGKPIIEVDDDTKP